MSLESDCLSSEVASFVEDFTGELQKGSRISYSIDYLLSLADVNVSQELPSGVDRSILSELIDACNNAHELQKLPGLESPSNFWITSDPSNESSERWNSCKSSSKDSKSADSGKAYSSQSRRSWQNPGNSASLKLLPNPESEGILGSWSAAKLPSAGSEVKLQGTNSCLLTKCKEPYRPPSFYKAMLHSGTQSHEISSNETSGCAECPSKERAMKENWRKDISIVSEEHSPVPEITSKKSPPPGFPTVSKSDESSCSAGEASEECCTEGSPGHQQMLQDPVVQLLPSKSQVIKIDPGVTVELEKFQGQIFKGGRFSALMNLEEAEDIDAYLVDEKNLALSENCRDGQSVMEANMEYIVKKELADYSVKWKETQIEDFLHVDAMGKTAGNSSAVDASISSASSFEPSYRDPILLSAIVYQDSNVVDSAAAVSKELHKENAPLTFDPDQSKVRPKIFDAFTPESWQSPNCTKNHGNIVEDIGSCSSDSRFVYRFTDNGHGKPKGPPTPAQKGPLSKKTQNGASELLSSQCAVLNNINPNGIIHYTSDVREPVLDKIGRNQDSGHASGKVCGFQNADETDSSLELNLPDEDSLITIDETYILKQDKPKPPLDISFRGARSISLRPGSNKLIGSETVQRNWSSPDPWFHDSRINSWNPSNSALVNSPSIYFDPWKIHHKSYNPFAALPPHPRQHSMRPKIFGPSVKNFVSPEIPHADDYCPDLDNILAAEPSIYHQLLQTPYHDQELNMLGFPPSHQTNGKSTMGEGKRGFLAEDRYKSTASQYLQAQRKLAQMNLLAEQRSYHSSKAINTMFW